MSFRLKDLLQEKFARRKERQSQGTTSTSSLRESSEIVNATQNDGQSADKNVEGLHVLVESTHGDIQSDSGTADIIAVHGIGGHAFRTWTHGNNCLWLRDLLPLDIAQLNVFTFGYNSMVMFSKSVSQIEEFARQLLRSIYEMTSNHSCPIVIICHSLGGIVVKKAISIADAERQRYGVILDRLKIVMFLGTPHRGSSIADLTTNIGKLINTGVRLTFLQPIGGLVRTDLLQLLKQDSEELDRINREFRVRAQQLVILSAYENTKHQHTGTTVVSKQSALLNFPLEDEIPLRGDHGGICRFRDRDDADYRDVCTALKAALTTKTLDDSSRAGAIGISRKQSSLHSFTESELDYVDSIGAPAQHYRQFIENKPVDSYLWLFQNNTFLQWFSSEQSAMLWTTGFAGIGKTTMLAFMIEHIRNGAFSSANVSPPPQSASSNISVYYAFCDDLDATQQNATSILRRILTQMMLQYKPILRLVRRVYSNTKERFEHSFDSVWKVFKLALTRIPSRTALIVLDGFDACDEHSRRTFLNSALELITASGDTPQPSVALKVLCSSRPFPSWASFGTTGSHHSPLRIPLETRPVELSDEITKMIDIRIRELIDRKVLNSKAAKELAQALKERADCSFLWVSIVLQDIENQAIITAARLRSTIYGLPKTVSAAYSQYLPKVTKEDEQMLRRLLAVLVTSMRLPYLSEIAELIVLQNNMTSSELQQHRLSSPRRTVELLLGPLVDIRHSTVRFMHASVRDFFLHVSADTSHPLHATHGVSLSDANKFMVETCADYLVLDTCGRDLDSYRDSASDHMEDVTSSASEQLPASSDEESATGSLNLNDVLFLQEPNVLRSRSLAGLVKDHAAYDYAATGMIAYLVGYDEDDIGIELLLQLRDKQEGVFFSNWYAYYVSRSATILPELEDIKNELVFSATFGWPKLMHYYLRQHPFPSQEMVNQALFWAISRSQEEIVRSFFAIPWLFENIHDVGRHLRAAAQAGSKEVLEQLLVLRNLHLYINEADESGRTALHLAVELNHRALVVILLSQPEIEVNALDKSQLTPLSYGTRSSASDAVKVLLNDRRTCINAKDARGRSAVSYAAEEGFLDLIHMLLSSAKLDVRSEDVRGRTALSYAAERCHEHVFRVLLNYGFSAAQTDSNGRNAVSWACNGRSLTGQGTERKSIILAAAEVEPLALDTPDNNGWTPMFWAVDTPGFPDAVEALLSTGRVDLNRRDKQSNRTVVNWAAAQGYLSCLESLAADPSIDIPAIDADGRSSLSHAASNGHLALVEWLLQRDPHLLQGRDKRGRSPLDWAVLSGNANVARLLECNVERT